MVATNILLYDMSGHGPDTLMIPPVLLSLSTELTITEFISRNVGSPRKPRVSHGFRKLLLQAGFLREKRLAMTSATSLPKTLCGMYAAFTDGAQ